MSSSRVSPSVALLLTLVALALPAVAGAAPQTYVSGVGNDADDCSLPTPCKTWAGAISKTDAGGTMTAVDSGGYGAVTITKSVTMDGGGHLSSALASGTNGVIVNGAGIDVVIKRVNIDNTGICTASTTSNGIRFIQGASLTVRDVNIQGFRGSGIALEPTNGHGTVIVRDSTIINNCIAGVSGASPAVSGDMTARLQDNLITGNATGVVAGAHVAVTTTGNTIVGNATQTATAGDGTLTSLGDNRIGGVTGTLGAFPAPPAAPVPVETPAAVPPVVVPPVVAPPVVKPAVTRCRVPTLTGLTLAGAKKALTRAHCRLGTVSYRIRKGLKRDRVAAQGIKRGSVRAIGTKVSLSISGRKPVKAKKKAKARSAAVIGPATRAWVATNGVDANPCSRTAPCRTFAKAITTVAQNGIVNVVGDGDYGPVTIDHALTIDGLGGPAAIAVGSGTAITVAAGAGEKVTLRDLDLTRAPACTTPGAGDGIVLQSGGPLLLDDVTVSGFPGAGLALPGGTAVVLGGALTDNCTAGLSTTAATATLDGVRIGDDATGIVAGDGGLAQLTGSDISDNALGLTVTGSGQIQGWPGNTFGPNTAAGFVAGTLPLS